MLYINLQMSYREYHIARHPTDINEKFLDWMDNVETHVFKKIKMNLLDLMDEPYRINFDDKMTCTEMADIVISNYNNEFKRIKELLESNN